MMWLLLLIALGRASDTPPPPAQPVSEVAESPRQKLQPQDVTVVIQDVGEVKALSMTHSFARVLPSFKALSDVPKIASTKWLFDNHLGYKAIAQHIQSRVDAVSDAIQRDLVIELKDALKYPAGNVGRRFDNRWLNTDIGFFQLIGVVNRIDKKDFYGTCGEVRFVYRLAYRNQDQASSRLPLTINVVMEPTEKDCVAFARKWVRPEGEKGIEWLRTGALRLGDLRFKELELNAQIVRFPSGLETEFAGQALYLLRVFGLASGPDGKPRSVEIPLENTPNVQALRADEALKQGFMAWLNENISAVDNGTYLIPEPYLATEALSYSTLGINRRANKPFDVLFEPDLLARLRQPAGELKWIKSKVSVVERLNNGSCIGCHQASTTAGFHFLGADDPDVSGVTNRLALPFSAHVQREFSRRQRQLAQFMKGEQEITFRPHSLAPESQSVGTNHACILDEHRIDLQPGAVWGCVESETCEKVVDSAVGFAFGQCMSKTEALLAGQTCRIGRITENESRSVGVFNLHAYADTFAQKQRYDLPENKRFFEDRYNCRPTRIGVPLGRTYRRCTAEERALEPQQRDPTNPEMCAVVGGARFDSCVEKDFHKCLDSIVGRGMVDSCHPGRFCREDYICQSLPYQLNGVDTERGRAIAESGVGFCTPTYFVFQLRLDGHPVP